MIACFDLFWQILRSSEGRELRKKHQENVRYLRTKLMDVGLPVVHCPSHIIPVHVGYSTGSILLYNII